MSDAGSRGRVKLGELTDAALAAADPLVHTGFVADLALVTRTPDAVSAVADRLITEGERGRLVFLEWLARLRVRVPEAVLNHVPAVFGDRQLPDDLRIRAAARALRSTHSYKHLLDPIVASLTAGLSPLAAVARLRAVQGRMRRSKVLDALIERRERRLRLRCPRCPARLGLAAMARHLYEIHGLVLDRGRARRIEKLAKHLRKRYAAARDTTHLDDAAALSPPAVLRAWAARTRPSAADLAPLLLDADSCGSGLCPRCLADLSPSVEPLPPPLAHSGGRLSGDGYVVDVRGPDGLRTCTVTTPDGVVRSGLDGGRAIGPRVTAVAAAAAVLAVAMWAKFPVLLAVLLAGVAYAVARLLHRPLPAANRRAIDRAWSDIVPRLHHDGTGDRLRTRLYRTSLGQGDPDARASRLNDAATTSDDPRVRAAARYLLTDDAAQLGVDRVGAVGQLVAAGFGGGEGLAFGESVAELFLSRDPSPADAARLRILALDAAFATGFTPRGLADVWVACPRLRDLMGGVPLSRLGVQYALWMSGTNPPWAAVASTGTVYDLAHLAPGVAGRLLQEHPDLLLYHRPSGVNDTFGWVLICARGVVVRGKLLAEAEAEERLDSTTRRLLRIRSEHLLPRLDAALAPVPSHPSLASLARRCVCGADVLVSPGRVGRVARFRLT